MRGIIQWFKNLGRGGTEDLSDFMYGNRYLITAILSMVDREPLTRIAEYEWIFVIGADSSFTAGTHFSLERHKFTPSMPRGWRGNTGTYRTIRGNEEIMSGAKMYHVVSHTEEILLLPDTVPFFKDRADYEFVVPTRKLCDAVHPQLHKYFLLEK